MTVLDILDERIVDLDMDVKSKDEAIRRLSAHLKEVGYIADVDEFVSDIYQRESEGRTGIGEGVAIPHGKSDSVKNLGIAVGRCRRAVAWESLDGKPVDIIFLFCISKNKYDAQHLKTIGDLAARLGRGNTIAKLRAMRTFFDLLEAFEDCPQVSARDMEELSEDIDIKIQN